jgi:hypothetical protein
LASDIPIPDFCNAPAPCHRRHYHHGGHAGWKALRLDLQLFARTLNPPLVGPDVLQRLEHFPECQPFPTVNARRRNKSFPIDFQNPPRIDLQSRVDAGLTPVLANCVANFQRRAANRYYGGDHIIFPGAVEAYAYNRQEPLLLARRLRAIMLPDGNATPKSSEKESRQSACASSGGFPDDRRKIRRQGDRIFPRRDARTGSRPPAW